MVNTKEADTTVLVPADAVTSGGTLVPLEVAEHGGFDGDVEVERLVRAYRYKRAGHGEAMQIAAHRTIHEGNLMQVEVIGTRHIEVPVGSGAQRTVYT